MVVQVKTPYAIALTDPGATDEGATGGKAAHLAYLAQAGFPVPPGFAATTGAYASHVRAPAVQEALEALAQVDPGDVEQLAAAAAAVRTAICAAPVSPAVSEAIRDAYAELGPDARVAVRSSGTAEDMSDASFAGQHDTYLSVQGSDHVMQALRKCWASMWSERAVRYRRERGIPDEHAEMAVVVQVMVDAEVAGVLFTANPVTAAVDEYLVNAAYGLGEGVVSGEVTPDQYTVARDEGFRVKSRVLGDKEARIVGVGGETVVEEVSAASRGAFALRDDQIVALCRLAQRCTALFGGWPQDIEWAGVGDKLYLLQSRDITGIDFCWDEDLEDYTDAPRLNETDVLSRARADAVWTGRITPLFYSIRSEARSLALPRIYRVWAGSERRQHAWGGGGRLPMGKLRWYKYHRGMVYFTSELEYRNLLEVVPPKLRVYCAAEMVAPSMLEDFSSRPGSWWRTFRVLARIALIRPAYRVDRIFRTIENTIQEAKHGLGLEPDAIAALSDAELKAYVDTTIAHQVEWVYGMSNMFYVYEPLATALLTWMLEHWYDGGEPISSADLITGLPAVTWTMKQNDAIRELADSVRASQSLLDAFRAHSGAAFFEEVRRRDDADARQFTRLYDAFLAQFGHRGQADRDIWYLRRLEDPSIDYRAISVLLEMEVQDGAPRETAIIAKREAQARAVAASLGRQRFGWAKARLFRYVNRFLLDFYVFRDDSRQQTDRNTFAKKRAIVEVGRRLVDRGVLDDHDDYYYLSKRELFALLDGAVDDLRVTRAKISARRRNCDLCGTDWLPPMYITGDGAPHVEADGELEGEGTGMRGNGMSSGSVTARARVIRNLDELERLEKGDVMIARATDPGWTVAFMVISGLVVETGGALAHSACLAREYALPAVQLRDAMARIPDGAEVHVDGTTGEVRVLDEAAPVPSDVGASDA
jgi:phosphohistidine swiveling domain-containing protein